MEPKDSTEAATPAQGGEVPLEASTIAFIHGHSANQVNLTRLLRRAAGRVALADSLDEIKDFSDYALVAVHYDALTAEEQRRLVEGFASHTHRPTLLLLSEKCAQRDFASLFGSHALTNMLVINESSVDPSDLLVTVQKIRQEDIFGLEKYFVWGIEPRSLRVTSSSQKNAAIDAIYEFTGTIDVAPRLRSLIRVVADEFITNAVYNAPVTADGQRRFTYRPRTEEVDLEPGEEIEVRFCCDGRRFGLSTCDPFGSLAPELLQDYLAKGFRRGSDQIADTSGGAGIGFYQILDSLSHFVINIEPGVRTEMIGLVDVTGSYKTFAASGKSFNIFLKEPTR